MTDDARHLAKLVRAYFAACERFTRVPLPSALLAMQKAERMLRAAAETKS